MVDAEDDLKVVRASVLCMVLYTFFGPCVILYGRESDYVTTKAVMEINILSCLLVLSVLGLLFEHALTHTYMELPSALRFG
jgi:hypothetical protein